MDCNQEKQLRISFELNSDTPTTLVETMAYESKFLNCFGVEEFRKFLSSPRLEKYLELADGDPEEALRLYKQNLEISIAFQIPLHFCEIAMRNAISETFSKVYKEDWPWNEGFKKSLNMDHRETLINAAKNVEEGATGKVISNLRFLFWEQMLANRYSGFWSNEIRNAFPNLPKDVDSFKLQRTLRRETHKVRIFRNKIAHHERIIESTREFNPTADLRRIFKLVYWRNSAAEKWLKSFERDGYFSAILEYKWRSE